MYGNKGPSKIPHVMNNELKSFTDCVGAKKLSLNESKTKLFPFRSTSEPITIILHIQT